MKYIGIVTLISLLAASVAAQRQNPSNKLQSTKQTAGNDTSCGTTADLAKKVEVCAQPLMDILEGTIQRWPTNEQDTARLCDSFLGSERCIRDVGRKCAKGLHKTIVSTIANSVQRARKRECIKPKYPGILKMTQCVEKHQDLVKEVMINVTSRLTVIEKQMPDLDVKTNSVCCMVYDIEQEMRTLFQPRCPSESTTIVKLYRAVLEDVIELICRQPKCDDIFKGHKIVRQTKHDGIISILLRIVFSLG